MSQPHDQLSSSRSSLLSAPPSAHESQSSSRTHTPYDSSVASPSRSLRSSTTSLDVLAEAYDDVFAGAESDGGDDQLVQLTQAADALLRQTHPQSSFNSQVRTNQGCSSVPRVPNVSRDEQNG
ncbi:uncharacterized protein I303_106517 [Kwoniella dejecticola CBS 10117]|uniref:Uncharacterized protein n=1 Tax=Kwoniella dejecticola CBS 10117 TaxID=1296121 RepID=A0A1A5ZUH1_9TREE|nr:uncharacterized protein I303_08225 [Kwoniella dejecticola CBS 10117]OBR81455.1 hypothetical protein I303_08225 [Kwoniella dejecticola CBS 10117]